MSHRITICTTPKKWEGEFAVIQKNAIRSWQDAGNPIFLLGNDSGTAEAAKELNCHHIKEIKKSEYKTPLLNSIFHEIKKNLKTEYILYVNADIILRGDFEQCIDACGVGKDFLIVGERKNAEVTNLLDFNEDWINRIIIDKRYCGRRSRDYFLFKSNMFENIPAFALGRGRWDSWMVGEALLKGIPVVDASDVITCIHQNHGFNIPNVSIKRGSWAHKGPENDSNIALIRRSHPSFGKLRTTAKLYYNSSGRLECQQVIRQD